MFCATSFAAAERMMLFAWSDSFSMLPFFGSQGANDMPTGIAGSTMVQRFPLTSVARPLVVDCSCVSFCMRLDVS